MDTPCLSEEQNGVTVSVNQWLFHAENLGFPLAVLSPPMRRDGVRGTARGRPPDIKESQHTAATEQ